jgi:mono/diheme cytochrome c family protein/glucose/arabinose dehydrogenase
MMKRNIWFGLLLVFWIFPDRVHAQQGDKKGEAQLDRVPRELIPPAPALTPAQALKTFKLAPGFRIELVAGEPLVESPVAMTFDADGRIWVVEMRGFMPNPDGTGEAEIPGRVAVLEDTDGDGRADKKTIFLDHLAMPRAIAMAGEGVLVGEPPHLWYCRDTNGDDVCDQKTEVAHDYGDPKNPEHTANGLVRDLDNWYYNLYHTYRYRLAGGKWERQPIGNRAQWGLTQDHFGRLYFTSNSDQLRGDMIPAHYAGTQPGLKLPGLNVQVAHDQTVWPGRVNPGVNRGYQPGTLRDDGTLARFTAACGTEIYRGHLFPPEFVGNAFVCEPAGNLVRRNVLTEKDGLVTARNPYEKSEFLTSTDERFRPVNLRTGPDGALYVVDMYHGILQHRIYVTTYLRKQIEDRGLDKPLFQGRIYRILPKTKRPDRPPRLAQAQPAALVRFLSHPNGWVRDTAQRLLVERGGDSAVNDLRAVARGEGLLLARLHALWTLGGLDGLDAETIARALSDPEPKIRVVGVRLAESFLKILTDTPEVKRVRSQVLALVHDPEAEVRMQLALSLGAVAFGPNIKDALASLREEKSNADVRKLAAFSLAAREPKPQETAAAQPKGRPLTPEEQSRFEKGRGVYEATCIACHQPHGLGQEGLAPPLVGSDWVKGSPHRLARIVLFGLRGPIKVKGETFELDMPSLAVLDDDQIAAVLTYVRRQWGHSFEPVVTETVKKAREQTADRVDAWTAEELLKIP